MSICMWKTKLYGAAEHYVGPLVTCWGQLHLLQLWFSRENGIGCFWSHCIVLIKFYLSILFSKLFLKKVWWHTIHDYVILWVIAFFMNNSFKTCEYFSAVISCDTAKIHNLYLLGCHSGGSNPTSRLYDLCPGSYTLSQTVWSICEHYQWPK